MYQEKTAKVQWYTEYFTSNKLLHTFNPFGGVGAFGLGLEQAGCVKVTHAVKISPSISQTLHMNSPDTVVYNECTNKVLKYAIKAHKGHSVEKLLNLFDGTPLPPLPKPKDIDCIITGFPCQPHSHMSMFQKANDIKSNLILNVLSWVDFLKLKFCILENVCGFLFFNHNATQAGIHCVEGSIEMSGLKFVICALVEMSDFSWFNWKNPGKECTHGNDDPHFLPIKCDNTLAKMVLGKTDFTLAAFHSYICEIQGGKLINSTGLQPNLWEWQFANPASAMVRSGFCPGSQESPNSHT
ncbi:hypothetical protein PILCRDRAFT_766532 [Piloderma croceum F 1598]|uniref:DNA (cytosine-5-)-methyltransferase n=1 Tax=Piloderma croceum (strain F 1598) TaxID=765440 RepID=A0A0C3GFP3_PILCF|nr:hypothetical protein PILCRDRAFT_766532 [Piloderma croceum F 1598]